MNRPCLGCGEPTSATRCDRCAEARGQYDWRWQRLSEKARRLQRFCSDCGATENLTADHSPEAWERKRRGLVIRLRDIDVVCGTCNRKRGDARESA